MIAERIIPLELPPDDPALGDHLERYRLAVSLLNSEDVVVDASCGAGYGAAMLAEKCQRVYGLDISDATITYAREHYPRPNVTFTVLNLDQEHVPECDVLVSLETIEHLTHPDTFLERAKSRTRRLAIISTPISPTKHINPFHLHDLDRNTVEELMSPWQPVYSCMQSGSFGEVYGIWAFVKSHDNSRPGFIELNLQDQQRQFLRLYNLLKKQKEWTTELEGGKSWLEEQRANWQKLAEEREQSIVELKGWIDRLQTGQGWLEQQRANWQKLAEERERIIAEQNDWIAQMEEGKTWLDAQRQSFKAKADQLEIMLQEQHARVSELEQEKASIKNNFSEYVENLEANTVFRALCRIRMLRRFSGAL
jgi:SAM-dependent methyltransferase